MKAMILAAGLGSRLGTLTRKTPKPMLDVGGLPLIERQLSWLAEAGVAEVVINLHHLGDQIQTHLGSGARFGLKLRYSHETERLETGGGVVKALPLLGPRPFWLLAGDIYTDFPLHTFPRTLSPGRLAHMLLVRKPDFRARGDFNWANGQVMERGDSHVFCGLALIDPALLAGCTATPFSLREHYFRAVAAGQVSGQVWSGYWMDIGSGEQLAAVRAHLRDQPG